MRKYFALVVLALCTECQPEDAVPSMNTDVDNFDSSAATLIKTGMLEGIGHTASGTASVFEKDGKKIIVLDPYSSQNGPDLKIYLSKDAEATEYIRLGSLKATSGRQSYEVPGTPDITQYHFVHVWCEKYTVVFARAEVK
jgi:hypothetical protein